MPHGPIVLEAPPGLDNNQFGELRWKSGPLIVRSIASFPIPSLRATSCRARPGAVIPIICTDDWASAPVSEFGVTPKPIVSFYIHLITRSNTTQLSGKQQPNWGTVEKPKANAWWTKPIVSPLLCYLAAFLRLLAIFQPSTLANMTSHLAQRASCCPERPVRWNANHPTWRPWAKPMGRLNVEIPILIPRGRFGTRPIASWAVPNPPLRRDIDTSWASGSVQMDIVDQDSWKTSKTRPSRIGKLNFSMAVSFQYGGDFLWQFLSHLMLSFMMKALQLSAQEQSGLNASSIQLPAWRFLGFLDVSPLFSVRIQCWRPNRSATWTHLVKISVFLFLTSFGCCVLFQTMFFCFLLTLLSGTVDLTGGSCLDLQPGEVCTVYCQGPNYFGDQLGAGCPATNLDPNKVINWLPPGCFCREPVPPPAGYLLGSTPNTYRCAPGYYGRANYRCQVDTETCEPIITLTGCSLLAQCAKPQVGPLLASVDDQKLNSWTTEHKKSPILFSETMLYSIQFDEWASIFPTLFPPPVHDLSGDLSRIPW